VTPRTLGGRIEVLKILLLDYVDDFSYFLHFLRRVLTCLQVEGTCGAQPWSRDRVPTHETGLAEEVEAFLNGLPLPPRCGTCGAQPWS